MQIKLIILLQTSEGWGRWGENTSWLSHNSDETLNIQSFDKPVRDG